MGKEKKIEHINVPLEQKITYNNRFSVKREATDRFLIAAIEGDSGSTYLTVTREELIQIHQAIGEMLK